MKKVIATRKHTEPNTVFVRTSKGWTKAGFFKRLFGKARYFTDKMIATDIANGYLKEVK